MFEQFMRFCVGWDASAAIGMSQKEVEGLGKENKQKYFSIIRTWKRARRYNVIPKKIKLLMRDPDNNFYLLQISDSVWKLYKVDKEGNNKQLYKNLFKRVPGYK